MATTSPPFTPPPLAAPPPLMLARQSAPFAIIITFVILTFFVVAFFLIYYSRCFFQNILSTWFLEHNPPTAPPIEPVKPAPGLDAAIVQAFPTFDYSSVKGYRREKYGLECAICLIEFYDSDILRFLTPCCHVFHRECIDSWLESHKTCPVCRKELDLIQSPGKLCPLVCDIDGEEDTSFVVMIKDDCVDETMDGKIVAQQSSSSQANCSIEKFSKSHSTGHSIVIEIENSCNKIEGDIDQDRYRLRLPEHVKSDIIKSHHNATRSCTQFGDL